MEEEEGVDGDIRVCGGRVGVDIDVQPRDYETLFKGIHDYSHFG